MGSRSAVAGGKAPVKELDQVDLGAGGGAHGGKVHVVDMDVPAGVGPGMLGLHDEHLVELLGPSLPYLSMVPMAVSPSMLAFSRLMSLSLAEEKVMSS